MPAPNLLPRQTKPETFASSTSAHATNRASVSHSAHESQRQPSLKSHRSSSSTASSDNLRNTSGNTTIGRSLTPNPFHFIPVCHIHSFGGIGRVAMPFDEFSRRFPVRCGPETEQERADADTDFIFTAIPVSAITTVSEHFDDPGHLACVV